MYPAVLTTVVAELASGLKSTGFVCWKKDRSVIGLDCQMVNVQPILEVGEVDEQYHCSMPPDRSAISEYCYSLSATSLT